MKRPQIIDRIAAVLRGMAPEANAILFGSEARGDAREDSDIDLLILLPDSYTDKAFVMRRLSISGALYDLALELGVEISPVILLKKIFYSRRTPFTCNVLNEGIKLQ